MSGEKMRNNVAQLAHKQKTLEFTALFCRKLVCQVAHKGRDIWHTNKRCGLSGVSVQCSVWERGERAARVECLECLGKNAEILQEMQDRRAARVECVGSERGSRPSRSSGQGERETKMNPRTANVYQIFSALKKSAGICNICKMG